MKLSRLFQKKTVQDILEQVEKNNTDGHNALGKHLTTRDLTAFGIAAIVGDGDIQHHRESQCRWRTCRYFPFLVYGFGL